ncbi:MAG: D-tyrosyl-tRNA(Tyr) deacylase [Planctomycetes bacterium]|nr:D-tyrosyl-tRNA(Tyr) deacylase [Planctomycetota bacterium]
MRVVVQRVVEARVRVDGAIVGEIGAGLLALVGLGQDDEPAALDWMADKLLGLRIFADDQGLMNRSVVDIEGRILAVSQFTLLGDCRKGRRPSFVHAMEPSRAEPLFASFVDRLRERGLHVATGVFGASMSVELVNDGPVTLIIDR